MYDRNTIPARFRIPWDADLAEEMLALSSVNLRLDGSCFAAGVPQAHAGGETISYQA